MPDIYLQVIDELVQVPPPDEGQITVVCRAWYGPGQYVPLNAYVNFTDTPNQMNAKVRQWVVDMCALSGVTVVPGDKVITACTFAAL